MDVFMLSWRRILDNPNDCSAELVIWAALMFDCWIEMTIEKLGGSL